MEVDRLLLKVYMQGFKDELKGKDFHSQLLRAYNLGRTDAIIGDDVRSVDYQSNEEILKRIKSH